MPALITLICKWHDCGSTGLLDYSNIWKRDSQVFAFAFAVSIREIPKQKYEESFLQMVVVLPKDNFHMLCILVIQTAFKFTMYNKCRCLSCQRVVCNRFWRPTTKICILALLFTICMNTVGKFLNFSAQFNFVSYIVLMTTVTYLTGLLLGLLGLSVKRCANENSVWCIEKAQ